MRAVLAIDQGTTGTTCLVIDERGELRGRAYAELPQHFPSPGWVEHDPEEIWASVVYAGREALNAAGVAWTIPAVSGSGADASSGAGPPRTSGAASGSVSGPGPGPGPGQFVERGPGQSVEANRYASVQPNRQPDQSGSVEPLDVVCIGITNQRETTVVWDRRTGETVHRAIVWQDRRTAERCRELAMRGLEPFVRERTGLVLDPYFAGTKVAWLLDHVTGARERAERGELAFGTVDSWLIWKLTGGQAGARHVTDPTNASRTLLFDVRRLAWSDELLEIFGVPRPLLPEVLPSSGTFGVAQPGVFGRALPITGVAGDQQAALYGQACFEAGQAKNTYGTGAFLLLHTGDAPVASRSGLLTTVACNARGGPAYALEGSIFIAGAAVQWLRDGLGVIESAGETAELAASLDSNDGVYFVPAFVGLGAPHWDPEARGTIVGLTRGCTRAHLARATLEAMAYATRDVLEAMVTDSGIRLSALAVDGGAAGNDWLMQFQADVLGVPIRRPRLVETTALGAAGLAGLGAGVWSDPRDFAAVRPEGSTFEPRMSADVRVQLVRGWDRAVAAAKAWAVYPAAAESLEAMAGRGAEAGSTPGESVAGKASNAPADGETAGQPGPAAPGAPVASSAAEVVSGPGPGPDVPASSGSGGSDA